MDQPNEESLGRSLLAEMRADGDALGEATDLLRWGADGVDDETLWQAVITAVEGAQDDGERWTLADGVIDESVATRPALLARWKAAYTTHESVREVYRVMQDPRWNWGYDGTGWWSEIAGGRP